jgi:histidinol-phosphate aminotransferase
MTMSTAELIRPEIRRLRAYQPADYLDGLVRLNANENPWSPGDQAGASGLNRYPNPRPVELTRRLAAHYGVASERLLVTRGSSEAIDILVRSFCAAGRDEIVISPPTFGMYQVYADIQGAGVRCVPLDRAAGFRLDTELVLSSWQPSSRLLFVCSPNNPTGTVVPLADLRRLCAGLTGRGVVVLDAAYAEFAEQDDSLALIDEFDNLLVLRTLSKALGLAGVRCGALIGDAAIVEIVGRTLPPYCFPVTSQAAVLRALDEATNGCREQVEMLKRERARLAAALAANSHVRQVWPSQANFLLVELDDAPAFLAAARAGGVLVRDFSRDPYTPGCVRITVGTPEENDQLMRAVK